MMTMVDPIGRRSAARSVSGSSQIWVYTSRRNQNAKSLSQTVASPSSRVLRTASAISSVFIHASNQQFDQGTAGSLQFCDKREARGVNDSLRFQNFALLLAGSGRPVTPLSREHLKGVSDTRDQEVHGCLHIPPISIAEPRGRSRQHAA